ncbi:MAG: hypothetical protein KDA32_01155 [Phycisphaerales bacterium]|nr:hypothetical protein [Phycisphaerales bacterium]
MALRTSKAIACLTVAFVGTAGCVAPPRIGARGEPPSVPSRAKSRAEIVARPILSLEPEANWTAVFNELIALGPDAVDQLANAPAMRYQSPPDSLDTLIHTSLIALLLRPGVAPRLSAYCFETGDSLVCLDFKVARRRLGPIAQPLAQPPRAWPDLFPGPFDHDRAEIVDPDLDRLAILKCVDEFRARGEAPPIARPLAPIDANLFDQLKLRYADRWTFQPPNSAVLCAGLAGADAPLIDTRTYDYNATRAACIWLGQSRNPETRRRLIELVGSPNPIESANARFALRFCDDPDVQAALRRFEAAQ